MCDYSLEMYASRPAREAPRKIRHYSLSFGERWPRLPWRFRTTAVCVQYDTHLKLQGISSEAQMRLGVAAAEATVSRRSDLFSKVNALVPPVRAAGIRVEFVAISGQAKAFRLAGLQAARELNERP